MPTEPNLIGIVNPDGPSRPPRSVTSKKSLKALENGNAQEILNSLSANQQKFCVEYLKDLNATQAAIRAGYKANNAQQVSTILMQNKAIRHSIESLRNQRTDYSSVTKDYVLRKIMKTIENAEEDGQHQAVLRGAELLARHLGMFIERTEISGPDGEAIKYEKTIEDAADFTSSIARLAKRS